MECEFHKPYNFNVTKNIVLMSLKNVILVSLQVIILVKCLSI